MYTLIKNMPKALKINYLITGLTTVCLALFSIEYSQAETDPNTRSNRQMAVTACNDYRESNRLPCFVSRKACPSGFEAITHFTSNHGPSFSACRDKRHEHPSRLNRPDHLFNTKNQQRLEQFNQLINEIEKHQTGAPVQLPKNTQKRLSIFFSAIDLTRIRLVHSELLASGCFTDCQQIYCASKDQIDAWTNPQVPVLSLKLLHQLAHAERCEIQGGRDRFVQIWLRHLPRDVLTTLERGDPIDTDKIHYATYMETHANNRAESICRRVGCIYD
jgi:hypothetical protein